MSDEFYIGYGDKTPSKLARWIAWTSASLILLTAATGFALVSTQNGFYPSIFEYGTVREYSGVLSNTPAPTLRLGDENETLLLVAEGKHGLDHPLLSPAGAPVELTGTLIQRDNTRMLEVVSGSISTINSVAGTTSPDVVALGSRTFVGEIVDSKCFLGVMNPGEKTVHRACARLCIRGGIPPMLHVFDADAGERHLLLTNASGDHNALLDTVLPFVATPVTVTGELFRHGQLVELRIGSDAVQLLD